MTPDQWRAANDETCLARRCRGCRDCDNPVTRGEAKDWLSTRLEFVADRGADGIDLDPLLDELEVTKGWAAIRTMSGDELWRFARDYRAN